MRAESEGVAAIPEQSVSRKRGGLMPIELTSPCGLCKNAFYVGNAFLVCKKNARQREELHGECSSFVADRDMLEAF